MMKRLFLILLTFHFSLLAFAQMGEVFTSMPDSLLPLLTDNNRHDMVDFYQNHMEAKVRNRLNDYARLDTLTDTYLRLTLSKASTAELKLLYTTDSVPVICMVQTYLAPVSDSHVRFFNNNWQPLHWLKMPVPSTADFFTEVPDSVGREMDFAQRGIDDLRLLEVSVSPDAPVFTLKISTDVLAEEEKKVARRYVRSLRYRWMGSDFVQE